MGIINNVAMPLIEIIVDDRERAVVGALYDCQDSAVGSGGRAGARATQFAGVRLCVKRIEVGDYCVVIDGVIRVIIERKSIADLASSISDGRIANIAKLRAARAETGCAIVYLIEGVIPRRGYVGAIPTHALQAHLDHVGVRDGVYVCYSRDIEATAERIFDLALNISTLPAPPPLANVRTVEQTLHPVKIPPSVRDKSVGILMNLSMGRITAEAIVDAFERGEAKGCIGDFLRHDWTTEDLMDSGVRYGNGAPLKRPLAAKIVAALSSAKTNNDTSIIKIPGMGAVMCSKLAELTTLTCLLDAFSPVALATKKLVPLRLLTAIKELLASKPADPAEENVDEKTDPADEKTDPADEKTDPADEKTDPADEKTDPVEVKKTLPAPAKKRKPRVKRQKIKPVVCEFDIDED
jgi:ERCC4-type nuclease